MGATSSFAFICFYYCFAAARDENSCGGHPPDTKKQKNILFSPLPHKDRDIDRKIHRQRETQ